MVTVLNAQFRDREIIVNGNTYSNVSGELLVNFDRESFTFICDSCKLKGVAKEDKADAEELIRRQYESFVLSDSIAAKEGKFIRFEYIDKEDLYVEKVK